MKTSQMPKLQEGKKERKDKGPLWKKKDSYQNFPISVGTKVAIME